jgi:peptide deformylase
MSGSVTLKVVHLGAKGDEILTEDLSGIQSDPRHIVGYFAEMSRLCKEQSSIGLAANQVGLRENFFFVTKNVRLLPHPGSLLIINPTWEPHKDGKIYTAKGEGCLSLPNSNGIGTRRFDVERWTKIAASWTDSSGSRVKPRTLSGLAAQVFQHESDHIKGIILTNKATEITIL